MLLSLFYGRGDNFLFKRGFIHRKSTKNLIIPINRRLKIDIKRESLLETVAGKGDLLGKHVVCLYINITWINQLLYEVPLLKRDGPIRIRAK